MKVDIPYFPDYDLLEEADKSLIQLDEGYSCRAVAKLDAAYQALQKGFIINNPVKRIDLETIVPTTADNYRFVKRFFHPLWSWYILILRLLTLHNPFKEISGFISQRTIGRVDLFEKIYPHDKVYSKFDSPLLRSAPKVSVIIPTLNRYNWLKDVLHDLEQQDYRNFDVIIVDQSKPFRHEFYQKFNLDIKIIEQRERALWLARNTAVQESSGLIIAFSEDDVRVDNEWLSNHIKCLDYFKADISAGIFFPAQDKIPQSRNFFRWTTLS